MKLKRIIFIVLIVNFMGMFSYSIVLPLLPYYSSTYGASPLMIGVIFSIYSLFQFFAAPLIGRLSDIQGRKKWFLASLFGTFLSFALMGWGNSIGWLLIARIIDGISGGNLLIAQAYISDNSTDTDRTKIYSYLSTTQGLGAIVGPAATALLTQSYGYPIAMFVAAMIAFSAFIIILVFMPTEKKTTITPSDKPLRFYLLQTLHKLNPKGLQFNDQLKNLFVISTVTGIVLGGFFSNLTQYMHLQLNFSSADTGWVLTFFGTVILIYQILFLKKLVKSLNDSRILFLGIVFMGIASITLSFSWNHLTIALCAAFYGISLTTIRSPLTSLITLNSFPDQKGENLGFLQSINSLTQIISPALGGWLMINIGLSSPGLFNFVAICVAGYFALNVIEKKDKN